MLLRSCLQVALALLPALLLGACNFSSEAVEKANNQANAPAVNAGADQDVVENTSVALAGSASGGAGALTYAWVQTAGPAVVIDSASSANTSFVAPNIGPGETASVTLRLSVTDSVGATGVDTVIFHVSEIAPSADAGGDLNAFAGSPVTLSGNARGSDTPLILNWSQLSGPTVQIDNPDTADARFTAPGVPLNETVVLTFQFRVDDSATRSAVDTMTVTVSERPTSVSISGSLQYEIPPPNANCMGLDFSNIQLRPIRGATVELVEAATTAVLGTTESDESGQYSFIADSQVPVFVRVRAQLKNTGFPSWDVEVRDNTSVVTAPLAQRPMYVLDGPASSPVGLNETRDMVARTGWTGFGFSGIRSAAPFSILDAVYRSMQLVRATDPAADFPPLDIFWSVNNTTAVGDIDDGEIGTSFYLPESNSLFLLGKDGDDIEDFDHHVIAHEWAHYLEDILFRSDSIGGAHSPNDRLDPRVAFSEGLATALSGIVLEDPAYCDAFWAQGVLSGFGIRLEDEVTGANAGWYNEASIMKLIYDIWDSQDDGVDTASLGFGAIYSVLAGPFRATDASTSAFPFFAHLQAENPAQTAYLDALVESESIVAAGIDSWGSTETNDAGSADSLPVFKTVSPDGSTFKVCSNNEFAGVGSKVADNRLNVHQLLRIDVVTEQRYEFDVRADAGTLASLPPDDPNSETDQSDPDILLFRAGELQNAVVGGEIEGTSDIANVETFVSSSVLPPATYVVDLVDYRHVDPATDSGYPVRTCFDVTVSAAP